MGADVSLVQFRKIAGSPNVSVGLLDPYDVGSAFVFAGLGSFGQGYNLPPDDYSDVVASTYRIRGGTVSWEAWIAARFDGAGFAVVSDIYWYMESFDSTGMGTSATVTGDYLIEPGTSVMDKSGIFMRKAPCAIELGVDPVPLSGWVPSAIPSWGLPPFQEGGWNLFAVGPGTFVEGTDPPTVLNLAPHNSAIPPVDDELWGSGILASDPEPRFSNVAVMSLVVAADATLGIRNPAVFALEWNES